MSMTTIDRFTERALALIAVLAAVIGLGADYWPVFATAAIGALALALVGVAIVSELARDKKVSA